MSNLIASARWDRLIRSHIGSTSCVLVMGVAALAGGCNSSTDSAAKSDAGWTKDSTVVSTASPTSKSRATVAPVNSPVGDSETQTHHRALVGAWMGGALINEEALLAAVDTLPVEQRQELIREARTFVTTEMAIEFSQSGQVETAVEIQPAGSQKIAGQTVGTWKIIDSTQHGVVVETTATDQTGQHVTTRTNYAVSADGNRIVLRPQVSPVLAGCEALIFLDRQPSSSAAANVAQVPAGRTTVR